MVTLLNRLTQPVTVNLPDKKSLHFAPKQSLIISFEEFKAEEIQSKVRNNILLIIKMDNE